MMSCIVYSKHLLEALSLLEGGTSFAGNWSRSLGWNQSVAAPHKPDTPSSNEGAAAQDLDLQHHIVAISLTT